MSKVDRAVHGPGWGEVILGALLSLLLGAVLASVVLVVKPVVTVKELPKPEERKRDAVYYIEGSRDTAKAKQAVAKRKAFVERQSVTVSEEEVNAILAGDPAPPAGQQKAPPAKAGEKKDPKAKQADPTAAAPDTGETMAVGTPNVRIRDNVVQVAAPVTLNALGLSQKVIVQARGGFVKKGEAFTYEPSQLYVGSCPVERLPGINAYVRNKIFAGKPIPEDIKAAWQKLSDVTVDGNVVRLSP